MSASAFYYYTNEAGLDWIRMTGVVSSNNPFAQGVWLSADNFDDPNEAQQYLALGTPPQYRIGPIPPALISDHIKIELRRVAPMFGQPGGGTQLMVSRPFRFDVVYNFSTGTYEVLEAPMHLRIVDITEEAKKTLVLVCGQDTTEIHRLRAIQDVLATLGYQGIIVKDQPDIDIETVEEKFIRLASIARFVLCENSVPSGHIDELNICSRMRKVTGILHQEGHGATWMQADYSVDFTFMRYFSYPDVISIDGAVRAAVEWSQQFFDVRSKKLKQVNPWRKT